MSARRKKRASAATDELANHRATLLERATVHVPFDGWTLTALRAAAADIGSSVTWNCRRANTTLHYSLHYLGLAPSGCSSELELSDELCLFAYELFWGVNAEEGEMAQ